MTILEDADFPQTVGISLWSYVDLIAALSEAIGAIGAVRPEFNLTPLIETKEASIEQLCRKLRQS
jgi:hypothetical protein